jgi:hypothetical protein
MRKAAHPSGGMGSSNPCRGRGERLHHGGGVCLLFVFLHDFTLIASVVGESVIGHGIGGIVIPAKMARLAKARHWSKR